MIVQIPTENSIGKYKDYGSEMVLDFAKLNLILFFQKIEVKGSRLNKKKSSLAIKLEKKTITPFFCYIYPRVLSKFIFGFFSLKIKRFGPRLYFVSILVPRLREKREAMFEKQ
jgi:hypothetical protein